MKLKIKDPYDIFITCLALFNKTDHVANITVYSRRTRYLYGSDFLVDLLNKYDIESYGSGIRMCDRKVLLIFIHDGDRKLIR